MPKPHTMLGFEAMEQRMVLSANLGGLNSYLLPHVEQDNSYNTGNEVAQKVQKVHGDELLQKVQKVHSKPAEFLTMTPSYSMDFLSQKAEDIPPEEDATQKVRTGFGDDLSQKVQKVNEGLQKVQKVRDYDYYMQKVQKVHGEELFQKVREVAGEELLQKVR